MDVSPLDKRTYLVVLHLLGDPIDSIFCLLLKVEAWSRCRRMAEKKWDLAHPMADDPNTNLEGWTGQVRKRLREWRISAWQVVRRVVQRVFKGMIGQSMTNGNENCERSDFVRTFGTVLGGIEELTSEDVNPHVVYDQLSRGMSPLDQDRFRTSVAHELANSRMDDIIRTCLAVSLYFYQVACAFITNLGGSATSPPGGRIGISMFLTYILPAILLSNVVGSFPSIYTCYCIIQQHLPEKRNLLELIDSTGSYGGRASQYFESRHWSGGIYTFRPEKALFNSRLPGDRPRWFLFVIAICPIVVSTAVGLAIIWHLPPPGLNCRWFVLLGISATYFFSTCITWLSRLFGLKGRCHWVLMLIKDFLIAVPSLFLLFASSSGLFNSCWCWSGVYMRGREKARIALNTELTFKPYIHKLYPALFGSCLALQLCAFVSMELVGWKGLILMRWSRRRRANITTGPFELEVSPPPPASDSEVSATVEVIPAPQDLPQAFPAARLRRERQDG
jgi:hypothetical protein